MCFLLFESMRPTDSRPDLRGLDCWQTIFIVTSSFQTRYLLIRSPLFVSIFFSNSSSLILRGIKFIGCYTFINSLSSSRTNFVSPSSPAPTSPHTSSYTEPRTPSLELQAQASTGTLSHHLDGRRDLRCLCT